MTPYYDHDGVTLYHGDCREVDAWLSADVLVTDPPYGRGWQQGGGLLNSAGQGKGGRGHDGIAHDFDTGARDDALSMWGDSRAAVVFGDLMLAPPAATKLVMVYRKSADAGIRGAVGGFRRDAEAVYLVGQWPTGIGGRSSVVTSGGRVGSLRGLAARYGHPHAKPVDLMEELIAACPPGAIADPFAGAGATLVAARNLGRSVIGVEIEERCCEIAAKRLCQEVLEFG